MAKGTAEPSTAGKSKRAQGRRAKRKGASGAPSQAAAPAAAAAEAAPQDSAAPGDEDQQSPTVAETVSAIAASLPPAGPAAATAAATATSSSSSSSSSSSTTSHTKGRGSNAYAYAYNMLGLRSRSEWGGADGKEGRKIRVLDSTLREGEQHPGVSFTNKQRIQIAWMLDYFGVDQIEISPVISGDHKEATKTIIKQKLHADIVAHGRAIREDIDAAIDCGASWCAAYLGVSDIHLRDKLRITRQEAARRAVDTVEYAKKHGLRIRFTLEDGSRADPGFLMDLCRQIRDAKVDRISLPDTVGIMHPAGMYEFVRMVRDEVDVALDVHVHNDMGLAVANALSACDAGADQIHTTIDGIGERTGIPPLAEVAVALTYLYGSGNDFRLDMLQDLSRLIEEYTGIPPYDSKPVVGPTAYKHKAGTHLAAILRNPAAYEPIPPRAVGNHRRIVFGELAGKTGASYLMSLLGLGGADAGSEKRARAVAAGLKELRMGDLIDLPLSDNLERKISEGEGEDA